MTSVIAAAGRALAAGDPLAALKGIALRDDAPALALRGIAMAQLGDLARAKELLGRAARAFGAKQPVARARCNLAEAEIALVSRDLGRPMEGLGAARATLAEHGDSTNAAHAGYLEARRLLLIGRLHEAERILGGLDARALPVTSRAGCALVAAGIAMRRIRARSARDALDRAARAADATGIAALKVEVDRAMQTFDAPAARLISHDGERLLRLDEVDALIASDTLIVDACRNVVRAGTSLISLASRPVLFGIARALAETWPGDVSRQELLARAFRAQVADESHRARLRVEMRNEIRRLQQELGLTAVYVTHDQLEAMTLADRLVVLNGGNIEQIGAPIDVYDKPASTFVASFIGSPAMNLLKVKADGNGLALATGTGLKGANAKGRDAYTIGIRPEHLEVVTAPGEGEGLHLEASVNVLEPVGAESYIYASFDEGGPEIVVRVSSHAVHHAGEKLHLRAAPDDVHFFDPDTGHRIA